MAYDEAMADRVRRALADQTRVEERKMFGGLAFLLQDHMCIGVNREDLMVRVGPDDYEAALEQPHARQMDFTGRPLRGFVFVDRKGVETKEDLDRWVERAVGFALSRCEFTRLGGSCEDLLFHSADR